MYILLLLSECGPDPESFEEYTCVGWGMTERRIKVTYQRLTYLSKTLYTHLPALIPNSQVSFKFQFSVTSGRWLSLFTEYSLQKYGIPPPAMALLIKLNFIYLHTSPMSLIVRKVRTVPWFPMSTVSRHVTSVYHGTCLASALETVWMHVV